MKRIMQNVRNNSIKILAIIFTVIIAIYFALGTIINLFHPTFFTSAFVYEVTRKMQSILVGKQSNQNQQSNQNKSDKNDKNKQIKAHQVIQIILNTMLSLILVLFIVNYSGLMIMIVKVISQQVHKQFISLILPNIPEVSAYLPYGHISSLYVLTGYLGLTAQLALTIDFIRLFNFPTILIYKILAFLYQYLLSWLKSCIKIIRHDPEYWLTCKDPSDIWIRDNWDWLSIVASGAIIILIQFLAFVSFYYLWLSFVIVVLVFALNCLKNLIILIDSITPLIFIIKGYGNTIFQDQDKHISRISQIGKYFIMEANFVPLIQLETIRDILVGKDILNLFKTKTISIQNNSYQFSFIKIYTSLTELNK